MLATRWFVVQRVGLTEEEDKYLKGLQQELGMRYPHQVLRYILYLHRELNTRPKPTRKKRTKGSQGKPKAR